MNIADELKALAEEMHFEFTQSQWEDALIKGWRSDLSMGGVLVCASGIDREITNIDWDRLRERAMSIKPRIEPFTSLKQPCRVWIANHAKFANDALWDGDYAKAKALLKKGGSRPSGMAENRRAAKDQMKKDNSGLMVIKVRERDTRSAWDVCK